MANMLASLPAYQPRVSENPLAALNPRYRWGGFSALEGRLVYRGLWGMLGGIVWQDTTIEQGSVGTAVWAMLGGVVKESVWDPVPAARHMAGRIAEGSSLAGYHLSTALHCLLFGCDFTGYWTLQP
jgi:hypothetical protein